MPLTPTPGDILRHGKRSLQSNPPEMQALCLPADVKALRLCHCFSKDAADGSACDRKSRSCTKNLSEDHGLNSIFIDVDQFVSWHAAEIILQLYGAA